MTRKTYTVSRIANVRRSELNDTSGNMNGNRTVNGLHLASSVRDLEKKADIKFKKQLTLKGCIERMVKLDKLASTARADGQIELEFLHLYRYNSLASDVSKYEEYKANKDKFKHHFKVAKGNLEKYEKLRELLSLRYEAARIASNSPVQSTPKPSSEKTKEVNTPIKDISDTSIQCSRLYSLVTDKHKDVSLFILDTRPAQDFKESHILWSNTINIPPEVIEKGKSAALLGNKLPSNSELLWKKRHTFEYLVILDWDSSEKTLNTNSKLNFLKEAMTKWDPNSHYRCLPLILEGGYEEILNRYPQITTNPRAKIPERSAVENNNSLDSLVYPMEDLEPERVIQPVPEVQKTRVVSFDRSTKPKQISAPAPKFSSPESETPKQILETSEEYGNDDDDDNDESSLSESGSSPAGNQMEDGDKSDVPPPPDEGVLNYLRKVKPKPETPKNIPSVPRATSITRESTDFEEEDRSDSYTVPLKTDSTCSNLKRSSSSPNIAQAKRSKESGLNTYSKPFSKVLKDEAMKHPTFSRENKPRPQATIGERADATFGKTTGGLTGLKNFANNCYMNSIVQCLSNTETLVKELTDLKKPGLNPHSKTKGEIAQEVIATLRCMWSGEIKVTSLKELKGLMGNIKDIFKGTSHQDSNEFLIILLEYLHEDLNVNNNMVILDGAEEDSGEKAWGEFKRKNCSVIQRLFYGQQKSTVTCATCSHASITFEPFFNLFVPIPSTSDRVSLTECIQMYMAGEKICGWKCPKCHTERNAIKKFDISKLPPILIIALKRFTQEDNSWLHKKENIVTYPLEDLNMEKFTVVGSEQRYLRYNLYAISTHSGTLRSGHYRAICKNYATNKWHLFDDQCIESLPPHLVANNPEAYILFYNAVN